MFQRYILKDSNSLPLQFLDNVEIATKTFFEACKVSQPDFNDVVEFYADIISLKKTPLDLGLDEYIKKCALLI